MKIDKNTFERIRSLTLEAQKFERLYNTKLLGNSSLAIVKNLPVQAISKNLHVPVISKFVYEQLESHLNAYRQLHESGFLDYINNDIPTNPYDLGTAKIIAEKIEAYLNVHRDIVGQIPLDSLEDMEMFATKALEYAPLMHSSLSLSNNIISNIENIYIKLPPTHIEYALNQNTLFTSDISGFRAHKHLENDYFLNTCAAETTDLGIVQFKTTQQTHIEVQSLKNDVNQLKEQILDDAKKKDEMLKELLEYYQNGGSNVVRIKKIKYNKKKAELIIDNRSINIRADSNQHYVCAVLFSNKMNLRKVWEIADIVEAIGEYYSSDKNWKSIIYNIVRHLNEKIQKCTGIDRFILYENKTIIVNPMYLDLK